MKGVSRLVLNETSKQLENSQKRIADLKQRLANLKQQDNEVKETSLVSTEELKNKISSLEAEETKVLRRLYLLIKQIKGSLQSECLMRVSEVISQNATICINHDTVDRLSHFSNESVVKLLKEFVSLYFVCESFNL